MEQRNHRKHDRQPDHEGDVDECSDLGDVHGPEAQGSVQTVPDRRVHEAAEPEAVGEGVARKRGQGDPTERQRLAHVAKCQRVIEHQQDIARARQPKRSDDPLPTERGEGLANVLRIVGGDLTMEEIKGATE